MINLRLGSYWVWYGITAQTIPSPHIRVFWKGRTYV